MKTHVNAKASTKEVKRDTRDEILHLAKELTQTKSFNWLSYQDLSEKLEIRKASIHYHFPSKTDLGVELLKGFRQSFVLWSERLKAKQASPTVMFEAYIEMYRRMLCDGEKVCPGGIFSMEWHTLPDEMQEELKGLIADNRSFLEKMIRAGRKAGAFVDTGTVEEQISLIGASLQGAMQISRVLGGANTYNGVARQLKALFVKKT